MPPYRMSREQFLDNVILPFLPPKPKPPILIKRHPSIHQDIPNHPNLLVGKLWILSLRTCHARFRYYCCACTQLIPKGSLYVAFYTRLKYPVHEPLPDGSKILRRVRVWRSHGECYLSSIAPNLPKLPRWGRYLARRPIWRWLGPRTPLKPLPSWLLRMQRNEKEDTQ